MNADFELTRELKEMYIDKIKESKKTYKKLYRMIKRTIDIIGALVGCLILVPLTIFVWIANIVSNDNGPVFYVQKRIGKNGKPFKMYKFRSMVVNADKKLKRYLLDNPDANEEYMKYRKLKNDPRITKVGKILRDTSLDEFPQFINVLKGDMSLVGPRPYLFREKKVINRAEQLITKVRPGLTGPWQVRGRNEISIEERIDIDIEYIQSENIKDDIKCISK